MVSQLKKEILDLRNNVNIRELVERSQLRKEILDLRNYVNIRELIVRISLQSKGKKSSVPILLLI